MSEYDETFHMSEARMPDDIRHLPLGIQVAVLYERVRNGNQRIDGLAKEVQALRRALWAFVFSIVSGALLFLFSIAAGWIGPVHGG